MSLLSQLLGFVAVFVFLACILYVVFGQVTVRKLRKNPKTKDALGLEYVSGWDIINVAQTFAFPRAWIYKVEKTKFAFIYADASLLYAHTTKFDRILGCVFYWLLTISGCSAAILALLEALGFFSV